MNPQIFNSHRENYKNINIKDALSDIAADLSSHLDAKLEPITFSIGSCEIDRLSSIGVSVDLKGALCAPIGINLLARICLTVNFDEAVFISAFLFPCAGNTVLLPSSGAGGPIHISRSPESWSEPNIADEFGSDEWEQIAADYSNLLNGP